MAGHSHGAALGEKEVQHVYTNLEVDSNFSEKIAAI